MLRTVCLSNVKWRRDLVIHIKLITGIAFPFSKILQLSALQCNVDREFKKIGLRYTFLALSINIALRVE